MKLPTPNFIGQRCKYTPEWLKTSRSKTDRQKRGIIAGYTRDLKYVRVLWDGTATPTTYSPVYIRVIYPLV
jgi:hypothetical protein